MYAPWFGSLPFYAGTFIKCCERSTKIRWVIHSDQASTSRKENIIWVECNDIKERISRIFPNEFIPDREWGHKLCDLKPFWNVIFNDGFESDFNGWCDWDVVHDLSQIDFNFRTAKFTNGRMCAPIFIQKSAEQLLLSPANPRQILSIKSSVAWDEHVYLANVESDCIQQGMTPEVDLYKPADFAVHMYRAKHDRNVYNEWLKKYCSKILN